jgi:hypothetical protein
MQNFWNNNSFDFTTTNIKKISVKESELSATHLMSTMKGHNHHRFLRRSNTLREAIGGISIITS